MSGSGYHWAGGYTNNCGDEAEDVVVVYWANRRPHDHASSTLELSLRRMGIDSSDDYYALLDTHEGADGAELRRAWRRIALQWHPDRAGPGATAIFQKLSAAYRVLSDPLTRAVYDRRRGIFARNVAVRSGDKKPESSTSEAPAPARRRAPAVMLHRLSGALNTLLACGMARRAVDGVIELFLNEEEVAEGGMITISMRVPIRCPDCSADATAACARCGTKRIIDELFSAWLAVPPGIADGVILTPSTLLDGMIRPVSFRVRTPNGR
jgi:hypothetical protein